MRLIRFTHNGDIKLGAVVDDMALDLSAVDSNIGNDLVTLLETPKGLAMLADAAAYATADHRIPMADVTLELPIAWPRRIFCLGLNYMEHVGESNFGKQDVPTVFMRTPTSLSAPDQPIIRPVISHQFDYEAELAVVIGKEIRNVDEKAALDAIAGYSCFNDGTIRDFQHATPQWTMGKNFDQTGSMGPWIVTADELPVGADGLTIQTRLNGKVLQKSNTSKMIFKVAETIAFISQGITLLPGDVIATGTPEGVGRARDPQVWMTEGDLVEIEIESIGTLGNKIVNEQ